MSHISVKEDIKTRSYLWAFVGKHPVNPGYGGSPSNAKQISWKVRAAKSDCLHLTEFRYMPKMTKLKPITRTKRAGRIMVRRRFRFHTAHVRSVRITDGCRSDITRNSGTKIEFTLRCSKSKARQYWNKNGNPSVSCPDERLRTSTAKGQIPTDTPGQIHPGWV